jgi:hypothetical protein
LDIGEKQRCPGCGSFDTRHSIRGGALDAAMRLFHKRPFRCRSCRTRFYRREEDVVDTPVERADRLEEEVG